MKTSFLSSPIEMFATLKLYQFYILLHGNIKTAVNGTMLVL